MPEILVIQLARLGDLVQTAPLLQSLKSLPANRVSLLLDQGLAVGAEGSVPADEIIPIDLKALHNVVNGRNTVEDYRKVSVSLKRLQSCRFEKVYNLNHANLNYGILSRINSGEVIGFRPGKKADSVVCSPAFRILFNQSHHRKYARMHLADLFRLLHEQPVLPEFPLWKVKPSWTAGTANRSQPNMRTVVRGMRSNYSQSKETGKVFAKSISDELTDNGFKHIVALHIGAGAEIRKWGAEKFAHTAGLIRQSAPAGFIIVGNDKQEAEIFKSRLSNFQGIIDLTGRTDIDRLAGALEVSDLVISSDSGPLQLAAAVGTKTLGLYFISAFVHETGPMGSGHYVIQALPECAPCNEEQPACMDLHCKDWITPDLTAQTAVSILNGKPLEGINPHSDVSIYHSAMDKDGQIYQLIAGDVFKEYGAFYRELWFRMMQGYIPDNYPSIRVQFGDVDAVEKAVSMIDAHAEYLPLAHHYYFTRADEGVEKAADEFVRALAILAEIGVKPLGRLESI